MKKINERRLGEFLRRIGVHPQLKGYIALKKAIMVFNPKMGITKELYPSVADAMQESASRVERVIRHAIEVAVKNNNLHFRETFPEWQGRVKPSNSEFIATVYYMITEEN